MPHGNELHAYEYVNRPYPTVARALTDDVVGLLGRATQRAARAVRPATAHLAVELGGLDFGADVELTVGAIRRTDAGAGHGPSTSIPIGWRSTTAAGLFPTMEAELLLYPLGPGETQIECNGSYTPPLGPVGIAIDKLVLHRFAQASVHRLVDELAAYLREQLPER